MKENDFRVIFQQEFLPEERRCEVRAGHQRCPEVAKYQLFYNDNKDEICERCMPAKIAFLTREGYMVTVMGMGKNGGG